MTARSVLHNQGTAIRRWARGRAPVSPRRGVRPDHGAPPAAIHVSWSNCNSPATPSPAAAGSQPDSASTWATTHSGGSSGHCRAVRSVTSGRYWRACSGMRAASTPDDGAVTSPPGTAPSVTPSTARSGPRRTFGTCTPHPTRSTRSAGAPRAPRGSCGATIRTPRRAARTGAEMWRAARGRPVRTGAAKVRHAAGGRCRRRGGVPRRPAAFLTNAPLPRTLPTSGPLVGTRSGRAAPARTAREAARRRHRGHELPQRRGVGAQRPGQLLGRVHEQSRRLGQRVRERAPSPHVRQQHQRCRRPLRADPGAPVAVRGASPSQGHRQHRHRLRTGLVEDGRGPPQRVERAAADQDVRQSVDLRPVRPASWPASRRPRSWCRPLRRRPPRPGPACRSPGTVRFGLAIRHARDPRPAPAPVRTEVASVRRRYPARRAPVPVGQGLLAGVDHQPPLLPHHGHDQPDPVRRAALPPSPGGRGGGGGHTRHVRLRPGLVGRALAHAR